MDRDGKGRFVPGNRANPKGRPPREKEVRYLDLMKQVVTDDDWKAIVKKATDQARRGDASARKWLSDYLIGAPTQRTELTGADGGALKLQAVEAAISRLYGDGDVSG